ncbi:hypothetical protein C5167_020854 [Papaver somniferum]|uniref:Transcription factor BREVIS RADIX N-terminal domain-containing protein n=2 Tax=Papaver somniferum TaxID=3469 RepID=A0A4Y7IY53_PAPSO|nr:uncharacterized protein LOC113350179 isoform X2 [Papaver somniferum]RZC52428.1 hypothetical protein C5167_020854 [Papaver somniferum]
MVAGDKTGKCKAAKEVIKSLTAQLKETAENVPQESTENRGSPTLVPNRENLSNLILAEAESNGDSAHSPVQNGLREQTEPKGRAPNDVLLYQGCHT